MKYKLTENSIEFNNKKLYQIQALKDFGNVKAGELGGYMEKELNNLSEADYCWLFGNPWVSNKCKIYNNGKVYDYIKVYDYNSGESYDYIKVCDNAKVSGNDVDKLETNQEEKQQPKHYDLTIQPIDYIIANKLDFAEGNIIKYVSRYKQKNGKEDLLKARYYLDLLIKEMGE